MRTWTTFGPVHGCLAIGLPAATYILFFGRLTICDIDKVFAKYELE